MFHLCMDEGFLFCFVFFFFFVFYLSFRKKCVWLVGWVCFFLYSNLVNFNHFSSDFTSYFYFPYFIFVVL
ncbi:hypothetical protein C8Q75DRAFT_158910 [Abortiporus biennis]|nr:hypothetical protein C8Q75DRAFT_158910 [Abortiporus biennis]